jgi:hypothetical protein
VRVFSFLEPELTALTAIKYHSTKADGSDNSGGKVFTYVAGTTTPQATYTTAALTTPNTNPVILDSTGRASIYLDPALSYKFVVTDSADVAVPEGTVDNWQGDALRADLASTAAGKGPALLGFAQTGDAGAVDRTLLEKLREIVSRADYNTDGDFSSAKGNKPNIDGLGNLDAKVTRAGAALQENLSSALNDIPAGPRDSIIYVNATSVRVSRNHAPMGGFRVRGHYTRGRAPTFAMPASKAASTSSNLGAESAVHTENWYAVFACANSGDGAAVLRLMPFLRAGTVSGSNVPLIKAGEGVHALTATTYAWGGTNNLANTDCLVISEAGAFSGRVTTITANVSGQVTLQTIGTVGAYDFLLPAPPGFAYYVYLGCFYFDTAEVRNIADAGSVVKAKMVNLADPNFTSGGAVALAVELRCGGYISPLATAVVMKDTHTVSTASTGTHAGYFWHDSSSHEINQNFEQKTNAGNMTVTYDGIELPFSQWQSIWYSTGGTLAASRSDASLEIKGWIEP